MDFACVSTKSRFLSASVNSGNPFFLWNRCRILRFLNAVTFSGVQEFETELKPWKFCSHNGGLADSQILSRANFRDVACVHMLADNARAWRKQVSFMELWNSNWPIVASTITWAFYNMFSFIPHRPAVRLHSQLTIDAGHPKHVFNQRPLRGYDYFAWWSTCINISRKYENILALFQKQINFLYSVPYHALITALTPQYNNAKRSWQIHALRTYVLS